MKSKLLTLSVIAHLFFGLSLRAQKGFTVEIIGQPQDAMLMGDIKTADATATPANPASPTYISLDKKFTFGIAAGAAAGYRFTDNMSISIGVLYSHQGQDYNTLHQSIAGSIQSNDLTYSISLNYLKIPVLFHFNTAPQNKISFSCYGGLYFGFLLNYEIETASTYNNIVFTDNYGNTIGTGSLTSSVNTSGTTETISYSSSIPPSVSGPNQFSLTSEPFNSFDIGATVGAGVEIKLSDKFTLPVMINYDIGFTDIKNHTSQIINTNRYVSYNSNYWGDSTDPNENSKLSNSTLGLRVGLKMKL